MKVILNTYIKLDGKKQATMDVLILETGIV